MFQEGGWRKKRGSVSEKEEGHTRKIINLTHDSLINNFDHIIHQTPWIGLKIPMILSGVPKHAHLLAYQSTV